MNVDMRYGMLMLRLVLVDELFSSDEFFSTKKRMRQRMSRPLQGQGLPISSSAPSLLRLLNSSSILLLFYLSQVYICTSFTSQLDLSSLGRQVMKKTLPLQPSTSILTATPYETHDLESSLPSLPTLYPCFSTILSSKGYITPTQIQLSSALPAKKGENLVLIAATGSGKTMAYFLPVLSRVCENNSSNNMQKQTALVIAPTRELASQLARDASLLLPDEIKHHPNDVEIFPNVILAVRGIPPPTPSQISRATVLIGTPDEVYAVLTRISGAQNFIAGDTLSGVILDEVDVLLPPTAKSFRTAFDDKGDNGNGRQERKLIEQRRKLRAAQRRGVEFQGGSSIKGKTIDSMDLSNARNSQVLTPTERVLRLIASKRYVGSESNSKREFQLHLMAGSATASRSTLDRLNKALRWAAMDGGVIGADGLEGVWKGRMKICRPQDGNHNQESKCQLTSERTDESDNGSSNDVHTIRAVTVPSVVNHKFVAISRNDATDSHAILSYVATILKNSPKSSAASGTSLVFICGEFSRPMVKEKEKDLPKVRAKTSQSRRNIERERAYIAKQHEENTSGKGLGKREPLSVRRACSILQDMGIHAHPMHVVLGLEPNAEFDGIIPEDDEKDGDKSLEIDLPPVLVTFEGSARGLHFDGVDTVFVVGRPTSAQSYLHLAGRVGRAKPLVGGRSDSSGFEVMPGTIVSFCSKGQTAELEKWTSQVSATALEEIRI